jgi:ribosome biogenesis GTPase A
LLDAPGVIPASFNNQVAAQRLAMCNDIGQASYIDSLIAAAMIIRFKQLPSARRICRRMGER